MFFVLGTTLSLAANGQMKEGRIVYERIIQMPVRMFSEHVEMATQLPRTRTDQYELLFNNKITLWQYLPNANNEEPGSFSGGGVVIRLAGGANDVSYQDLEKNIRVDQREIAERNFVVADTIQKLNWQLSDETKTILNFTTHKATARRIGTRPQVTMENGEMKRQMIADTATIVAWYTTEIASSIGPDFQGQLPGAILELDVNKGQSVYKALEVSPKVNVAKIKEPKDGRKLTAAEFGIERDKLMEEMRKNMPRGNVIRMN